MAIELEDPFHGCSLISLLPKTLAAASHAQIADSETDDPNSIKSLFKAMVVKGSTQIVQQAQTIIKNKTNTHNLHPEDGSFGANCKDHQPERRPALGRKRAKFSLHPVPSHSVLKTDISSSIDHIDDPEEYFLAFEQLENAEKELKKLRGEVYTDPFQHHQGTTARKRRPGLLRKTASYKHHTSANVETAETVVRSQESHLDSIDAGPCNLFHSKPVDELAPSQAKNTKNDLSGSTENEGSVAEKEERVGNLLEGLLSSFKYIDGDEGETFLRESLQIKPNDAGIFRPALPSFRISQHGVLNNRTVHGELNNSVILSPSTKSLLQVTSALRRRSLKDPLKDLCPLFPGNDSPCSGGSCLSKSTGKESFSPVIVGNHNDCGFLLVGASSSLGFEDGANSPHAEADRFVGHNCVSEERLSKLPYPKLEGKTNPDIIAVGNENGHISDEFDGSLQQGNDVLLDHVIQEPDAELLHSDSQCRMQEIVDSPSQLLGEDANCDSLSGGKGKDVFGGLPVEGDNLQLDLLITNQPDAAVEFQSPIADLECSNSQRRMQEIVDNPSQLLGEDANCDSLAGGKGNDVFGSLPVEGDNLQLDLLVTNQPDAAVEFQSPTCANQTLRESLENPLKKRGGNNSSSVTDVEMSYPVLDDMSQFEVPVQEKVSDAETSKDNSSPPEVTALPDRCLENQHSLPDEYNEEDQIASGQPPNEVNTQKAPRPPRSKKNKSFTRRQSLAGGGTIWEDGRRRSSRRRFRPLEHWRGEKLLYGRVHSSLATVIGVKYASPGKNHLKVESCVSEEYAELVALAARC